jgi:hypothetical protein
VLTIQRWGDNQVRISWVADTGFTLERSTVADGGYADAGLSVAVEEDENVAYDTISSGEQFYRLVNAVSGPPQSPRAGTQN